MRVLVTGAAGTVGTALVDGLGDRYDLTLLDREPHPDHETTVADVTDLDAVRAAADGQNAVVHLAASPAITADWATVYEANIGGTYAALQAAADAGVESFVFASSIHAVGLYENEHAPDLYAPDYDLVLDHTVPPRPDSFYGVSKVFGEAIGRLYVEGLENPLSRVDPDYETTVREAPERCYSLRILSVRDPAGDHPYGLAEAGVEAGKWARGSDAYELMVDRLKCTWLSRRDLVQLVDRCLQDETVTYDVFYGVSDNDGRWVDLDHAREVLGYEPVDNGAEWDAPPG